MSSPTPYDKLTQAFGAVLGASGVAVTALGASCFFGSLFGSWLLVPDAAMPTSAYGGGEVLGIILAIVLVVFGTAFGTLVAGAGVLFTVPGGAICLRSGGAKQRRPAIAHGAKAGRPEGADGAYIARSNSSLAMIMR